ncbi:MAG: FHA domain-containing protein, partial [Planctomycetaceae bacterium]|nr:FHA domain-containing protein [Planctomycetaceae bacterium]
HAGLLVQDRGEDRHGGHTGALYVADQVVQNGERHLLGPDQVNASLSLELPFALGLQYDKTFEFDLDIFGGDNDPAYDASQADEELRLLLQAVGTGRKPPLWGFVEHNGMESVRLRRRRNLEQEQYVLLYRKGLIGNSDSRCPICINDGTLPPVAAQLVYLDRAFWLHNLGNEGTVTVEGQVLEAGEMVPLRVGMQLQLGQTSVQFQQAQQLHL